MPDEDPTGFRIAGEQPPIPVGTAVNLSRPNRRFEIARDLPRTATGKVQRNKLREQLRRDRS